MPKAGGESNIPVTLTPSEGGNDQSEDLSEDLINFNEMLRGT